MRELKQKAKTYEMQINSLWEQTNYTYILAFLGFDVTSPWTVKRLWSWLMMCFGYCLIIIYWCCLSLLSVPFSELKGSLRRESYPWLYRLASCTGLGVPLLLMNMCWACLYLIANNCCWWSGHSLPWSYFGCRTHYNFIDSILDMLREAVTTLPHLHAIISFFDWLKHLFFSVSLECKQRV